MPQTPGPTFIIYSRSPLTYFFELGTFQPSVTLSPFFTRAETLGKIFSTENYVSLLWEFHSIR